MIYIFIGILIVLIIIAVTLIIKKVSFTINVAPSVINLNIPETTVNMGSNIVNVEKQTINVPSPSIRVIIPSDVSKLAEEAHRAKVLQKQPDGSYSEVGHVDYESKNNPGERILRELKTPDRAILWPDGSIQES